MKNFDYMRSSLDFCLYPQEIVQRFAGKEVIVYGTNYEGYNFLQVFAQHLKISVVINHFDVEDFQKNGNIRDLDELCLYRTTEPIFILSRNFWVEIVDYLERKGLVLGSDIFFWEQGLPMNDLIAAFIEHNQKLWKSEAIVSKNKVLITFEATRHDCPYNVNYAYTGNYLAKLYNAEIYCYPRMNKLSDFVYSSKSIHDVARSHNVVGMLDFECDQEQSAIARELFKQIWTEIDSWDDVKQLEIAGINFGISMLRDYLRHYTPSLNTHSESFAQFLLFILKRIVFLLDYFQKNNRDIKAVVLLDGVARDSFLRDIALAYKIPTYTIHYTGPSFKCNSMYNSPNEECFTHYKEFFRQLSPKEKEVGIEWAKRSLEARLNGDNKEITYMKTSIYEMKPGDRVLEQNDKLKVLICPHTLEDDLAPYGWQIFANLLGWMIHLGELSNRTDYDWYLKMHPVSKERDHAFIKEFLAKYPRIKMIPMWTSPKQLRDEGIKFAFTMHGTLGHEYPALGIQVVKDRKSVV